MTTIYSTSKQTKTYPPLERDIHCNIAIIGGGLSGLSIAYLLAKHKQNIVLLEADTIAQSNSGRNTGKITLQQGLIYDKVISKHGKQAAQHYVARQKQAFDTIRTIIDSNKIDCDYTIHDSVMYTTIDDEIPDYEKEWEASRQLGLDVTMTETVAIDPACKKALIMHNQASYNPKTYCDALAALCVANGVTIYEKTAATAYHKEEHITTIETSRQNKIIADHVIVATSYPCFDDGNLYFLRLPNLRSYIVSGQSTNPSLNNMDRYYITTNKPTKSFRSYRNQLMICGEDHRVGVEVPNPFRNLKERGHKDYGIETFMHEWAAQDYLTQDLLPYCGYLSPYTKRMYVATGYNQWGNINAMTCALVLTNLITSQPDPLIDTLSPQRVLSILGTDFLTDNADMINQLIQSKFQKKGKVPIDPNTHAIVAVNGKTYGAYMNEHNQLYLVDLLCPHMGCTLRFNDAEKTWDCPCHSSRFQVNGSILSGPATQPLHLFNDGYNSIDPHWFD